MIADFSRFSVSGGGKHLTKNGTIFLLVSSSLHLRSGRVEEVHAWINNTLQLGTISKLSSEFVTYSFFFILGVWFPWSFEPEETILAQKLLMVGKDILRVKFSSSWGFFNAKVGNLASCSWCLIDVAHGASIPFSERSGVCSRWPKAHTRNRCAKTLNWGLSKGCCSHWLGN
jgi:hypothetical protein